MFLSLWMSVDGLRDQAEEGCGHVAGASDGLLERGPGSLI